jgi:NitT/TauT family transport system permease protein
MTAARLGSGSRTTGALIPIALALAAFLVLWKAVVLVGGYPTFILPPPESVIARFVSGWQDGILARHTAATLVEVGLGFGIGSVLAILTGYLLARSRLAERLLSPYLVAAQATPILALAPVLVLWFGP